jgi:ketosteroid isomerase-like protein
MIRQRPLWLCAAWLVGCAAPIRPTAPAAVDHDARALIELEHRWVASYVAGDAGFLDRLFRDDVVLVNTRGEISSKRQEVDELRSGAVRYQTFDTWDLAPRLYGDVAVVTARSHVVGVVTASGRAFDVQMRVIDVFVRGAGRWQLVASQGTRVE